jgi:hypothetical protein
MRLKNVLRRLCPPVLYDRLRPVQPQQSAAADPRVTLGHNAILTAHVDHLGNGRLVVGATRSSMASCRCNVTAPKYASAGTLS